MAPALTSNFHNFQYLRSSKVSVRKQTKLSQRISVKLNFGIGKRSLDDERQQVQSEEPRKSGGFNFDFAKFSDVKSLVPVLGTQSAGLTFGAGRRKDAGTVFVAGATGQSGVRLAWTLLREGFAVRAGVPDLGAAQDLAQLAAKYKLITSEESRRLNAVEITLQDAESIAKAIGNASKVVITVGPNEDGPSTALTTSDALQVVLGAQLAGVAHVAIVYDSCPLSITSTYNVLDGITSFFSNLFSRSQQSLSLSDFLQKIIETDIRYTLIKASLAEDYSTDFSGNIVVKPEGKNGEDELKVSRSQIASLVAGVFANTAVAENKVVEVFTDPSAPSKSIDELFSVIPEDGRRKEYAEALTKAKAEKEALQASERAREAAEAAKKLEEEVKKLSEQEARAASLAEEAKEKAKAAGSSLEGLMSKAKDISGGLSWEKLSSQIGNVVTTQGNGQLKVQIATVSGEAKARSLTPKRALLKQPVSKPKPKPKPQPKMQPKSSESKTEVKSVFGGLFKQETIYVDDD